MKRFAIAIMLGLAPTPTFAFGEGATFDGCGAGETSNLFGAFAILSKTVSSGYGELLRCLDDAYLIEHDGKTAHQITRR